VNAGHDPVKAPKHLRRRWRQWKVRSWEQVFFQILTVFEALADDERNPEKTLGYIEFDVHQNDDGKWEYVVYPKIERGTRFRPIRFSLLPRPFK
jgi:hypothetical protein